MPPFEMRTREAAVEEFRPSITPSHAPPPRPSDDGIDAGLLRRMAAGDRAALGELFDRHAEAALGLAHRILRNRQDAEDLVHDVFLEAWQKAESYDERRARVRAWLMVRVRSRSIDRLRALEVARRHAMADAAMPDPLPAASANPEATSDGVRARAALSELVVEQRRVIELAYFEGLTLREVSERIDVPLGTVKSRLAAGLAAMRTRLGPAFASVDAPTGGLDRGATR